MNKVNRDFIIANTPIEQEYSGLTIVDLDGMDGVLLVPQIVGVDLFDPGFDSATQKKHIHGCVEINEPALQVEWVRLALEFVDGRKTSVRVDVSGAVTDFRHEFDAHTDVRVVRLRAVDVKSKGCVFDYWDWSKEDSLSDCPFLTAWTFPNVGPVRAVESSAPTLYELEGPKHGDLD